jgi:hypothetical protein
MTIKTASWFTELPADHVMVGISRGVPRRGLIAGFRMFRKLAPGPWFHSVSTREYERLYRAQVLAPLDPREVAAQLLDLAGGRVPVMVCFERAGAEAWCHRALAAGWLSDALGETVPEFGHELISQHHHPLLPPNGGRKPGRG